MPEELQLPKQIAEITQNLPFKKDCIGQSDSTILLFENMVLKIEKTTPQANHEHLIMQWLQNRLPVPKVIAFEQMDGYNYLLMSKLDGEMACSPHNLHKPEDTIIALANSLKALWHIDISTCPFSSKLDKRLLDAKYNMDHNLVDTEDFNEDTLGENGFSDVNDLYNFLKTHKPPEDLVFSHGDFCLPNIFIKEKQPVGFLDLGKAGIADRWQDIALCVRSLKYNICDFLGLDNQTFLQYKQLFYTELGIYEDAEKLRYYILLDELF